MLPQQVEQFQHFVFAGYANAYPDAGGLSFSGAFKGTGFQSFHIGDKEIGLGGLNPLANRQTIILEGSLQSLNAI